MLNLTADIAEELLRLKDAELSDLPDGLKLKIISLAELAAMPSVESDFEPEVETKVEPEVEVVVETEVKAVSEVEGNPAKEADELDESEEPDDSDVSDDESEKNAEMEEDVVIEEVAEPDVKQQVLPEPEPVCEKRPAKSRPQLNPADLQRVFSINDEFLFCREIFNGSKSAYMRALEYIAKLPNRWALQVFLVEELGLNLNESPGKEFYHTLVVFFK